MHEPAVLPADYLQQITQWQAQRLDQLLAPSGWLNLTGFGWLKRGANRVGSAAGNDIVLRSGPAHLGLLTLDENDEAWLQLAPDCTAHIEGSAVREARLLDDGGGAAAPTQLRFGSASLYLIRRDGRIAVRARDDAGGGQQRFGGLEYFAVDPAWRLAADWIPFATPSKLRLQRRLGSVSTVEVPGEARFRWQGRTHTLLPYQEKPGGELFFVLGDLTSGKETYENARFLYAALPVDGKLVLDFNQTHNPPSAFTPYANCPLAPPENQLALRVTVGEKRYRGHRRA